MVKRYYGTASVTGRKMFAEKLRETEWSRKAGFRQSTVGHGGLGVFGLETCNKQVRIRFCNLGGGSGI